MHEMRTQGTLRRLPDVSARIPQSRRLGSALGNLGRGLGLSFSVFL